MDKLTELAIKYKTDKWGKHHYTPVYDKIFKDRRNEVKKVLEIGVAEGAGLRMFRDYFPNAIIYGAENDPKRVFVEPPIQVFLCDQSNEKDLNRLLSNIGTDIDFVIDDGSHRPEHQLFTAQTLLRQLDTGVIYIIEDVSDPMINRGLTKYQPKRHKLSGRYDDELMILTK